MTGVEITLIGKLLLLTGEAISVDLSRALHDEAVRIIKDSAEKIESPATDQAEELGEAHAQAWKEGFDFDR